jgi:hypothetical protein
LLPGTWSNPRTIFNVSIRGGNTLLIAPHTTDLACQRPVWSSSTNHKIFYHNGRTQHLVSY